MARQGDLANVFEHVQQFINGIRAQVRVSGMRHLAAGANIDPQISFAPYHQFVFRGFAVDNVARAPWVQISFSGAITYSFLPHQKEQGEVLDAFLLEPFRGRQLRCQDSLGITGAAA